MRVPLVAAGLFMLTGCAGDMSGQTSLPQDDASAIDAHTRPRDAANIDGATVRQRDAIMEMFDAMVSERDASFSIPDAAVREPDARVSMPDASEPNLCADTVCNTPPNSQCISGFDERSYARRGTCNAGKCSYSHTDVACPAACDSGTGRCSPTIGWDWNLRHRCVQSRLPNHPNAHVDRSDCPVAGKNWLVTVNAEKEGMTGTQCAGVQDVALPLNAGSGANIYWQKHKDEFGRDNWIVNLRSDWMNHSHPCGGKTFTFLGFADHRYLGGGSFPAPSQLSHYAQIKYDDWTPNGASRAIAFFAGEWNGKGIWVEIDLASQNWGDAYPNVPDIVQALKLSDTFHWAEVYGPAIGLSLPRKQWTKMNIPWSDILKNLISRGYLEAPQGGLANARTVGLGLAIETRNNAATGASAELWLTDWRAGK